VLGVGPGKTTRVVETHSPVDAILSERGADPGQRQSAALLRRTLTDLRSAEPNLIDKDLNDAGASADLRSGGCRNDRLTHPDQWNGCAPGGILDMLDRHEPGSFIERPA
jgi:hypothetical protein